MNFQRLSVVFESEGGHSVEDILSPNRLPLLQLAFFSRLACNKADKFGDTFLHTFLGIFGDFSGRRNGGLHDTRDIRYLDCVIERPKRRPNYFDTQVENDLVPCTLLPLDLLSAQVQHRLVGRPHHLEQRQLAAVQT